MSPPTPRDCLDCYGAGATRLGTCLTCRGSGAATCSARGCYAVATADIDDELVCASCALETWRFDPAVPPPSPAPLPGAYPPNWTAAGWARLWAAVTGPDA
jgi:hypothetical protein